MQVTKQVLEKETEGLPEPMLEEVVDFVRFLKTKVAQDRLETTLLSQAVLERDWLRPEEDAAWQDL